MCYHDLIPWVPDLPVAGCVHTPSRLSRSTASAACGFLYSQRTAKTDSHGSHPVSRSCETLLPSDMAFSSRFFLFARKKTAQARRVRRRTEKIHDKKAYFPETPLPKPQTCGMLWTGRRSSGSRVRTHSAGLSCSNTAGRLLFYNIILA